MEDWIIDLKKQVFLNYIRKETVYYKTVECMEEINNNINKIKKICDNDIFFSVIKLENKLFDYKVCLAEEIIDFALDYYINNIKG